MSSVKHRQVFFISGFDPKGAAYYHRLYRDQAKLQGALTHTVYQVSPRRPCGDGNSAWTVLSDATQTNYEYVRWDDIVRAQWPRGVWQVLASSVKVYARVVAQPRMLLKTWHTARRTLVAFFYPAAFWLALASLALAFAVLLNEAVANVTGSMLAGIAAVCGAGAVMAAGLAIEKRLHTSWLLRIFGFAQRHAAGQVPDLSERMAVLSDKIRQALLKPEVDEVLLVGFSVGSVAAVTAAARTAAACQANPQALSKLSMLTLGHCIPLFALWPSAQALRAELRLLASHAGIFWVDCSAPSDWGSFALVDPVQLCAPTSQAFNPRAVTSPRFHTLFAADVYARLKKDKRRMHMQYLMAAERAGEAVGGYDYFALTAGPARLSQRYVQKAA